MALNLTNFDAALKQHYTKERIFDMVYRNNPFLAMVPKYEKFGGRNLPIPITYGHPQGRSATFSTAQTNKGNSSITDFVLTRKSDYSLVSITGETIEATKGDANAFMDAVSFEIDNGIASLKRSLATALFRNGSGSIGQVGSISTTTVTLKNTKDVVNFEVGMEIASDTVDGGGTVNSGTATITAIDRDAGTLTTDSNWTSQIASLAADDYLFVQGDYDAKVAGLMAWIPATAPTSTAFYGVDRSVDTVRLGGVRYDGSNDTIDEALIEGANRAALNGGEPDCVFMSYAKYAALEKALGPKVRYENVEVPGVEFGFRGISLAGPGGVMKVIPDHNCPNSYAFVLTMNTWKFYSLGPAPHILNHDGMTSLRESSSDGVEVRIGYYGNLGCRAPGFNAIVTLP